jgi:hypothetical protein
VSWAIVAGSLSGVLDSQDGVLRALISQQFAPSPVHLAAISNGRYGVCVHHAGSPALHEALPLESKVVRLFIGDGLLRAPSLTSP